MIDHNLKLGCYSLDEAYERCKAISAKKGWEPKSRTYAETQFRACREAALHHNRWFTVPAHDCDTSYQCRNYHMLTITVGREDGEVLASYWCPGFEFAPELRDDDPTFFEGCKTFEEAQARLYEAVDQFELIEVRS